MGIIEIDGSYLEGGGQILRVAVALSAATGKACRIVNIRKGRRFPGMAAQHLSGVEAVARVCGAEMSGASPGSTTLEFRPGPLRPPDKVSVAVGTAGSVTLVLQALLVPVVAARRTLAVSVTGGTHVQWAPTADYFREVLCFFLNRMGAGIEVLETRPGFYPKGGGLISLTLAPEPLRALMLVGPVGQPVTKAYSIATKDLRRARVAERQLAAAGEALRIDEAKFDYVESPSTGTAIYVSVEYDNCRMGASALGERGTPAEKVGQQAGRALLRCIAAGACLDDHMTDQILPYMALGPGPSQVRVSGVTDHCRTSIWVIEQFVPARFTVEEERRLISCQT